MLETVEQQTGAAPEWSVIWLHGLGADGHDFEPVVDELPLESDVVDDPVPLPEFVEVVEELSSVVCELLEVSDVLWGLLGALVDFVSSTTVVWSSVEDDPSLVPMPAPGVARFTMMA